MSQPLQIIALIIAYLVGSIPSAVWIGKLFYGIDVREYGSGNAGATNTFRVLGKKAGVPVLLIDILKGFAAVQLPYLTEFIPGSVQFVNLQLVLGVAALFGHIFPLFAAFKGGKGIATLLGIILAVHPYAALVSIGVFLVVFLISNYVSLGSITAAITFPIVVITVFKTQIPSLVIFSMVIAVLVLITHQKNIERLLKREESKSRLIGKKSSDGI
jgi:glycerol-3-phosphate acyltransferase PlsY